MAVLGDALDHADFILGAYVLEVLAKKDNVKLLLKIWIWFAGGLTVIIVGLFVIGFAIGISDGEPVNEDAPEEQVLSPHVGDQIGKTSGDIPVDDRPIVAKKALSLPDPLTAKTAIEWLSNEGLLSLENGGIHMDRAEFSRLNSEQFLALYQLFDQATQAEDRKYSTLETEQLKSRYYGVRLLIFASGSVLPEDQRRKFASKSGAVYPPSAFSHRIRRGDYLALFDWHKGGSKAIAENAIRDYAKILTDKEMIYVLSQIGAITTPDYSVNRNASSRWSIHPGEALSGLNPETQQAIHDAVKDTFMGDRRKLKKAIRKIIAANHTAGDLDAK
ncbi:MAG: hypothetical protein ACSHXY_02650 [Alphaproteobacteria bacterium]